MNLSLTRAQLLSLGARGGTAVVLGGSALAAGAGTARAAAPRTPLGTLGVADLAYARMLIGVELLSVDFYTTAIASQHLRSSALADARLALINESEHYTYLASALTAAAQTPLSAADVNFSYPGGSFSSAGVLTRLTVRLEALSLGAYLGAAGNLTSAVLAQAVAQITANEAQHLAVFAHRAGSLAFHDAFPGALSIAEASDALAAYTS